MTTSRFRCQWLLLITALAAASPCLGDDRNNLERAAAAEEVPLTGFEKEADQDTPKDEPAAEPADEAKPDLPEPVGKLGIRKGTGRPAGQRAVAPVGGRWEDAINDRNRLAPADEDPAIDEQVQQMRKRLEPQLRTLLHAEVYFVHLVCNTNAAQRERLLVAAEPELKKTAIEVAKRMVASGGAMQGRRVVRVVNGNAMVVHDDAAVASQTEPVEIIRNELMRLVSEQIGENQARLLRQEIQQRVEAQRRGTISNIIAQLDAFLVLSPEQQERLVDLLLAGWNDQWKKIPQQMHDQYLPAMQLPAAALAVLSGEQRKRWQAIPKIQTSEDQPREVFGVQGEDRWKTALEQLDRDEQEDQASQ